MTNDHPGYIEWVRENIGDPTNLRLARCPSCEHVIGFRCWPAELDPGVLNAFLDGLCTVAQRTDLPVFGQWMLDSSSSPDGSIELWAAPGPRRLATGRVDTVTKFMCEHICASLDLPRQ